MGEIAGFAALAYPVVAIMALIGAWVLYARRRHRAALIVVGLPLLPLLTLLGSVTVFLATR